MLESKPVQQTALYPLWHVGVDGMQKLTSLRRRTFKDQERNDFPWRDRNLLYQGSDFRGVTFTAPSEEHSFDHYCSHPPEIPVFFND